VLPLSVVFALVPASSFEADRSDDPEPVLVGKTKRVIDGDTIKVVLDSGEISVRLASIDAPEHNQPFGRQATSELRDLVDGRTVELSPQKQDRFNRLVAIVYVDGVNANTELVRRGAAWAYNKYLTDKTLPAVEEEARQEKRGLWASTESVPPWEFRHRKKQVDKGDEPDEEAPFACGAKDTCPEMVNCDEAQVYFKQCGAKSLDGDHDGVPCEELCR
jgi:endonuclease YncB( thermonuclease family)